MDLMNVVNEIRSQQNLGMPVLIRFQDIIRHRVEALNDAFRKSIAEFGYQGRYQGVYPIKVNQMREVVEEIVDAGRPFDFGLEAGSKAELSAVISMNLTPQSLVICNGYKDYSFIKTALMGIKLGKRVIIVVEKLTELYQIIAVAKEMGVTPLIGVRTKLYSKGSGKWESSGGEFAKWVAVVERAGEVFGGPDILTNGDAAEHARDLDGLGGGAGLEITRFVEDVVGWR